MKYFIALALIAFAFAPALSQEIDCTEEFFRVSRRADSCQDFFICMIGGRVDFRCEDGDIFDEERATCRRGDSETCEFLAMEIPADSCREQFLRVSPHPDPVLCAEFFICMNFNIVRFRCDYGFIFSRTTERCVLGNQETCREGESVPFKNFLHAIKL